MAGGSLDLYESIHAHCRVNLVCTYKLHIYTYIYIAHFIHTCPLNTCPCAHTYINADALTIPGFVYPNGKYNHLGYQFYAALARDLAWHCCHGSPSHSFQSHKRESNLKDQQQIQSLVVSSWYLAFHPGNPQTIPTQSTPVYVAAYAAHCCLQHNTAACATKHIPLVLASLLILLAFRPSKPWRIPTQSIPFYPAALAACSRPQHKTSAQATSKSPWCLRSHISIRPFCRPTKMSLGSASTILLCSGGISPSQTDQIKPKASQQFIDL